MGVVTIPHFDFPFKYVGGKAAVVQQDSLEDVENCVDAAVNTEAGTRAWVPDFGIDDSTFADQPINLSNMERQITLSEPRAILDMSQAVATPDLLAEKIVIGVRSA